MGGGSPIENQEGNRLNVEDKTSREANAQHENADGMGTSSSSSRDAGRTDRGSSIQGNSDGSSSRESGSDLEAHGDHRGAGHRSRVPEPKDVEGLDAALLDAFQSGDPARAWHLTRELVALAGEAVREAARVRFQANFGTKRCANCEGLKAGPGVSATCFQIQQCYYRNVKEVDATPKQERFLKNI